jgi:hypothetical protein
LSVEPTVRLKCSEQRDDHDLLFAVLVR